MFSRCQTEFLTRLKLNNTNLEQQKAICFLGIWITEDLSWQKNTEEICIKAYKRVSLLTKLKYVGVKTNDLIDVYKLFIRSCLEYCNIVFHSRLTQNQTKMIENLQVLSLKIICGDDYENYKSALRKYSLSTLQSRRENRILSFSEKCLKHPVHSKMFSLSEKYQSDLHHIRDPKRFIVNKAHTMAYQQSFIPYAQRKLNKQYAGGVKWLAQYNIYFPLFKLVSFEYTNLCTVISNDFSQKIKTS